MFLLGLAAARAELFRRLDELAPALRRALPWALGVGAAANAGFVAAQELAAPRVPSWPATAGVAAYLVGAPALSFAYAAALALALRQPWARRLLSPLGAVGRTALSNYLLQSLVCTTLAYGYGGRLYGTVGPARACLLALAIAAAQIPLSVWWLRRYRFGPAEWLWRAVTYLRIP